MSEKAVQWRLRGGMDRRFRAGHPWVYSNELAESPKGLPPGAPVELRDAGGKFLARGYGNPGSLIAFRTLSRIEDEVEPTSPAFVARRLSDARALREKLGYGSASYRLCFGEADGIPGLIVDRYRLEKGSKADEAFVIQAHTAGSDRLLPSVIEALGGERSAVVVRNDVGVRKLEGLVEEPARVARAPGGFDPREARILIASLGEPVVFVADLLEGQKTGFFLDQAANVRTAAQLFVAGRGTKKMRILDLCCYVGQWGAQLAAAARGRGIEVEVTAVDASARALELARRNVEAQGARCTPLKADVLKELGSLEPASFDIVISDPPAFIKGRKDLPTGSRAYLQLNTQVFKLVREGGAVVCSSCSSLFPEEDFVTMLAKASQRSARSVKWIARGGQGPDHPVLAEFPEGRYLKTWMGIVC